MAEDPPLEGATTGASGTPFAVDLARDRRARSMWVVLLGGPLLWLSHFMFVYLVAEAGCTGDGPGLELFDPPVPKAVTLVATALAAAGCVPLAIWALRRWRTETQEPARDSADLAGRIGDAAGRGTVPFAGFLLASFSLVAIVFVGLPAAFLPAC
jgi:hypothetical protein